MKDKDNTLALARDFIKRQGAMPDTNRLTAIMKMITISWSL